MAINLRLVLPREGTDEIFTMKLPGACGDLKHRRSRSGASGRFKSKGWFISHGCFGNISDAPVAMKPTRKTRMPHYVAMHASPQPCVPHYANRHIFLN